MQSIINAKTLRAELAAVLERVRKGECITVVYRSRAVCRLVPVEAVEQPLGAPTDDPLYRAAAVGRSSDGLGSSEHDAVLYGAGWDSGFASGRRCARGYFQRFGFALRERSHALHEGLAAEVNLPRQVLPKAWQANPSTNEIDVLDPRRSARAPERSQQGIHGKP